MSVENGRTSRRQRRAEERQGESGPELLLPKPFRQGGASGQRGDGEEKPQNQLYPHHRYEDKSTNQGPGQRADGGDGVETAGGLAQSGHIPGRQFDGEWGDRSEQHRRRAKQQGGGQQCPPGRAAGLFGDQRDQRLTEEADPGHTESGDQQESAENDQGGVAVRQPAAPPVAQGHGGEKDTDDRAPDVDAAAEVGGEQTRREDLESHQHRAGGGHDQVETSCRQVAHEKLDRR